MSRRRVRASVFALLVLLPGSAWSGVLRVEGAYVLPSGPRDGFPGVGLSYLNHLGDRAHWGLSAGYSRYERPRGGARSYVDFRCLLEVDVARGETFAVASRFGLGLTTAILEFSEESQARNSLIPPVAYRDGLGAQAGFGFDYRPAGRVGAFLDLRWHMIILEVIGEDFVSLTGGLRLRLGS